VVPATGLDDPNSPNPTATLTESIVYTLIVTNPQGCSVSQTVSIDINAVSTSVELTDAAICPGETATLDAGSFADYLWSDGSSGQTHTVATPGTYSVTVTDAVNGCNATASAVITALPEPAPAILGEPTFVTGLTTTLQADAAYASYLWSTGETAASINVGAANTYSLTVTNSDGCSGSTSVNVSEIIVAPYIIPSAFSPNGDNVNDGFMVIATSQNISNVEMTVYNRWGEQMFFSNDLTQSWNGKFKGQDCEIGTYAYFGSLTLSNGEVKEFKGNVTLIR
jgi:gliding motility-associated-like protein